jgi:hypothetical protein
MKKPLPPLPIEDELLFLEYEDLLFDMEEHGRELDELWEAFKAGAVPADVDLDAPLTIEQALHLPELGGSYTVNPELRSASETVKAKTLRGAIERGDLRVEWFNSKNMYTTRRWVREWLEAGCLDRKTQRRNSSSGSPARTSRAASPTMGTGSSTTRTSRSPTASSGASISEESARMIVQQLRESSRHTPPGNTRKS